jgi:methylmalonyl-CoA mutase
MAGVAIDSIYDMRTLFSGIPLDQMSVSMTMNGAVLPVLALYIVAAEEQGVPRPSSRGPSRTTSSKSSWSATPISIRLRPRCGSSRTSSPTPREHAEIQLDLDLRLSHAGGRRDAGPRTRLHARRRRRIRAPALPRASDRQVFAPRLSFFWAIGMNFFMEVAKMRAARLLWAKLIKEFNAQDERSLSLRTHCQTSGWSLTAQDVFNNVPRTMIEAMAATQGHTQSLHTNALDEALALPTDFSARIARNTQIVLQQESGTTASSIRGAALLCRAADLRTRGEKAWEPHPGGRALGGMAKAIEAGIPKLRIEEAAAKTQARIDSGRPAIDHRRQQIQAENEAQIDVLKVDNATVRAQQLDKLARLKAERNEAERRRSRSHRADQRRQGRRQPARPRGRGGAGEGHGRRDLGLAMERCSAVTAPRSRRSPASTSGRREP